ncbi:isopentenyl-diphosphate delta-isomerase [Arthrobacter sp. MYb229]|uniref:isopentenyl-diphosphate Delta-isomerase n=1 Tax=unclassified Arthrobacter TaxID=235627 RepID=UPI000CFB9240|nr:MULTISPECIES: isopentenyl-diphosphate Delta-isomerase [unclassified Arthrobacter]PQZ99189.1 isopentenyl-diphosphate delta-isomerase [Arthrobacter sp. MYb229]PRB47574.1 isopentenyl-diphosphate delta-isomerase [Arthrobacter sp. MYb216]
MDVILLSEDGEPIGSCPKELVHTENTPLHQAFSCYLFNAQGQLLVTRRALSKLTWPGVWTNSFCGHPMPGEELVDAVRRHAAHELGAQIADPQVVLAEFAYRAVDACGIVENERCPVFIATLQNELAPNPEEVMDFQWVEAEKLEAAVQGTPWAFSPWMGWQLAEFSPRPTP